MGYGERMQHRKHITTQVGLHLPIKLVERLGTYCDGSGRTKVSVVIDALESWLDAKEPARGGQELDGGI